MGLPENRKTPKDASWRHSHRPPQDAAKSPFLRNVYNYVIACCIR